MTGKDLGVIIRCHQHSCERWMSFASWYSLYKLIPDAKVAVCLIRGAPDISSLVWPYKCDVPVFQCSEDDDPFECVSYGDRKRFYMKSSTMAVRSYEGILNVTHAKSSEMTTFVDYSEGCGNFVMAEWINSLSMPFMKVDSFRHDDMTVNEIAVLKLWERMYHFYAML
jgi:hypothetical protein